MKSFMAILQYELTSQHLGERVMLALVLLPPANTPCNLASQGKLSLWLNKYQLYPPKGTSWELAAVQ